MMFICQHIHMYGGISQPCLIAGDGASLQILRSNMVKPIKRRENSWLQTVLRPISLRKQGTRNILESCLPQWHVNFGT